MSGRKQTPRGQSSRSANSGPAVMLMPPHIRATFMPNPPLEHVPPVTLRRKNPITGVSSYLTNFEKTPPPPRKIQPTPKSLKDKARREKNEQYKESLQPLIEQYRKEQKESGGEYEGINCYNTLFVARLMYEVTERKLLREMEAFGTVKVCYFIRNDAVVIMILLVVYSCESSVLSSTLKSSKIKKTSPEDTPLSSTSTKRT